MCGGDDAYVPKAAIWDAIKDGLRAGDGGKFLLTYHPLPSYGPEQPPWVQVHLLQTGHGSQDANIYEPIASWRNSGKPILNAEPQYEDAGIGFVLTNGRFTGYDARQAAYWCVLAGAAGHTYGHHAIWTMWDQDMVGSEFFSGNQPSLFWHDQAAIDSQGARSMAHLRKLINSRPFLELVPDQGLVVDALSGEAHIRAARGQAYAYIYSATGRPFTVNMARISGAQVKAYWFDPKNGKVTFVGRFANSGQRTFHPPVTPERGSDMVLILDDAGANYPLPGTV
jgi:hypothetical protein